jgi:hypothetical protein
MDSTLKKAPATGQLKTASIFVQAAGVTLRLDHLSRFLYQRSAAGVP